MASKFKIRLKVQSLELEVEGSRDDIPVIAHNVGQQIAGLFQPAVGIVEGSAPEINQPALPFTEAQLVSPQNGSKKKTPSRPRASKPPVSGNGAKVDAIDWRHDPAKWGNPQQDWSTSDKSIWLLYVVANETEKKALPSQQLVQTFNKHFYQAGRIRTQNINRDLGAKKRQKMPLVGEDTTQTPSTWFLTHEGDKKAQELIADARGITEPTYGNGKE